jgi:signal transduction histidine kinase
MFERARRRLAIRYVAVFLLVLTVFSAVFLGVLAVALRPAFDIGPEFPDGLDGQAAYDRALLTIAAALVVADALILLAVAAFALRLADRSLRPIREAHDRQRRFVADASHEMRTPLAAIRSTADAALTESSGRPPGEDAALQTILQATDRLTRLTNDLLVLARTDGPALGRDLRTVDLSVVVAEAVERFCAAQPAPDRVRLSLASDLLVAADGVEIDRIVTNLLDNAIRYGGGHRPVEVRTIESDGRAIVEVVDDGPGIAGADIGRIFEPFYRVRSDAAAADGTGLGLAIAADLARRNGGRLSVDSAPGTGSTFRLSLVRFT